MSGGQGYIGSKISLISRSDIRYVGVLHNINSEDSTVALEHVNSFGTEGRRGNPSEEIPPSDNVFEYIVFRGSDIKDLQVFEPPAPKKAAPPPQQYPNDPAIMSSSMETYAPKQPASAAANYTQAPYYGQTPPVNSMPAQQQTGADTRAPKPEPVVAENAVVDVAPVAQAPPATAAARAEVTSSDVEELAKSVSGMNVTGFEKTMPSGPSNKLPGTGEHLIRPNNRGNRNSRVNVRYNAHANSTTAPNSNNNRVYVPKSDFDFETSNAKFNKDNVLKEVVYHNDDEYAANAIPQDEEEVVIPPADDYYNRTKSFFDNISCEAKERQEQGNTKYGDNRRSKFHEERKLNVETFGQASVDQGRHRGYRGRGGHRGHRGRGGYRGGRGGGYNNRQQSTTA